MFFNAINILLNLVLFLLIIFPFVIRFFIYIQEEKIYREKRGKSDKIKKQSIEMGFIEGQLENLNKEYEERLKSIDRMKQFLRDIAPFIRK